jgi:hypothetical protein
MRLEDSLREPPGKHGDSNDNQAQALQMSDNTSAIYHSNRYNAQAACEHCEGIIRPEPWCITIHPAVYYAYQIVADPSKLTLGDALILHSLGVIWGGKACRGKLHKEQDSGVER